MPEPKAPPARVAENERKVASRDAGSLPADAIASEPAAAATQHAVQKLMDEGTEKGWLGDEKPEGYTPNEHYTLAGVAAGLPTPENQPPKNR